MDSKIGKGQKGKEGSEGADVPFQEGGRPEPESVKTETGTKKALSKVVRPAFVGLRKAHFTLKDALEGADLSNLSEATKDDLELCAREIAALAQLLAKIKSGK